jgi:hypothetical protein
VYVTIANAEFTIPDPNVDFNEADVNSPAFKAALMWAPGVGTQEKSVTISSQYDKNRIEILRVMVACFCDSLFQSPDQYDSCLSMWLEVATSVDTPFAEIAFNSLMNVVLGKQVLCHYDSELLRKFTGYDPIGWGVPYGGAVSTDTARSLMEVAVQALVIMLDYGHPVKAAAKRSTDDTDLPFVSSTRI